MKQTLYKIEEDYLALISDIEANEGEVSEEQIEALRINESELQGKSIAYLEVIKSLEARNTLIDEEIKRLQAMKKVSNNTIDRLKDSLLNAVKIFGSFDSGLVNFGTRKSTSINITCDVNDLPKEYKTIKVTEAADKTALKKAIQSGEVIEGVELVDNLNLKIK